MQSSGKVSPGSNQVDVSPARPLNCRISDIQDGGITLTWRHLVVKAKHSKRRWWKWHQSLEVTPPRDVGAQILCDVSGSIHSTTLMAIMGASGTGKTTLLNCLSARNTNNLEVTGDIAINGRPLTRSMRNIMAYVQQDDIFIPSLTVKEHLQFHAHLVMGRISTSRERNGRIQMLLEELGLQKCSDVKIGSPETEKGLSGGERKRLSFATEILTDPPLLFCDEPTTGLDSYNAHKVASILRRLATRGKTVLCTIHSPSSEVFTLFDKLLLLGEGRVAYAGPTSGALDFFRRCGHCCPATFNPADYYIQVLAVHAGFETRDRAIVKILCDSFENSIYGQEEEAVLDFHLSFPTDVKMNAGYYQSKKAQWIIQFYLLLWRSLVDSFRNPTIQTTRIIQKSLVGVMIAAIYFDIHLTQTGITAVNGLIFLALTESTFPPMYGVLETFPREFPVFTRENCNNVYRTDAYYLAKVAALVPGLLMESVLFVVIIYWAAGLASSLRAFLLTTAVIILTTHTAHACGMFFSAAFKSSAIALMLLIPFDVLLMVSGGIFINVESLPVYLSWAEYLSWFRHANEAIMIVQWSEAKNISCEGEPDISCITDGGQVLKQHGFSPDHFQWNVTGLAILYFGFHILGFISLFIRVNR